jgi:hypothetical protein
MDIISEFANGTRMFAHWYSGKKKYGNQIKVNNKEEVIELIKKYNGIENCGISICSFVNGVPKLLYLPFDFDSSNLRDAFDDAKRLYNFLVDLGYQAMFNFSGSKGFHVIVPIIPKVYTKIQLLKTQQFFKRILKLETADEMIFRDIRRIMRLPGTYHMNGNLCDTYVYNDTGKLLDIESLSPPDFKKNTIDSFSNIKKPNHIMYHDFPCVDRLINDETYWRKHHPRNSYEPHWLIRFAFVIQRMNEGKSDIEIFDEICSFNWDDLDEERTVYNIKYIMDNEYIHPTCNTFQEAGLCLDDCPYKSKWNAKKINGS